MKATLVIKNGAVYTVDEGQSWAQSIAISGRNIIFVGSNADVETFIEPDTVIIDLAGKMVLPAFVDSHMHPAEGAYQYKFGLNLHGVNGEDIIEAYLIAIADYTENKPNIPWIVGGGYSRSAFDELGPRKEWLDEIEPRRPIALTSVDGHSMWVNSKALDLAEITRDTPQPEEGVIKHDPQTGEPSGLLQEPGAMKLVGKHFPNPSKEQVKEALLWLQGWLNAKGITTVHEAMLGLEEAHIYEAYDELAQEGKMTVRYRASWSMSPEGDIMAQIEHGKSLADKFSHPHFKTHSFKFFADHVIEEETGYLMEPYSHRGDDWYGIKVWDDDILHKAFTQIDSAGFQIHVHVIGDAAAQYTLDALEKMQSENGKRDARHSFAHLQMAKPEDIQRMADLDISVHTSPYWMMIDDYFWKLSIPYLGRQRAFEGQYPCNSLLEAGINMTVASDFFVTEPDPIEAIYSGITRLMPKTGFDKTYAVKSGYRWASDPNADLNKGDLGVLPPLEECACLEDMLTASTLNGAHANFLDGELGSIRVGKLADLVVLDQNLFEIDIDAIPKTRIVMTLFEGEVVYSGGLP